MNEKVHTIKDAIQDRIEAGAVTMKSKRYFILQTAAYIAAGVLLVLGIVYLISFVWFMLRVRGVWEVSSFGFAGVPTFLFSIPWIIVIVGALLVMVFELFLKKKTIAYKTPLVVSLLAVIILVVGVGYAFSRLPLHQALYERSFDDRPAPLVGPLYRSLVDEPLHNVTFGIVEEVFSDQLHMQTPEEDMVIVLITDDTRMRRGELPQVTDSIMVLGDRDDEYITAVGIKIISDDKPYPRMRPSVKPTQKLDMQRPLP